MKSFLSLCLLLAASPFATAGVVNRISEPGSFELLAMAGVAAVVVALRNRRK